MDEDAFRTWLITCFGPAQGELAWQQLSQLPEPVREQLLSQDPSTLPNPAEVQQLMNAFTMGGMNTPDDLQQASQEGPINIKLAKSLALQHANADGSRTTVSAEEGEAVRRAMCEANLWLDTACEFAPPAGQPQALTRAEWVEETLDAWAKFAAPIATSMSEALTSVLSERLGDSFHGEITGMFAGPIPIPVPDGIKDPIQLIKILGNTSFAMQLGHAAGVLSREVHGGFDQGIALLSNPAGALVAQNIQEYAKSLNGQMDDSLHDIGDMHDVSGVHDIDDMHGIGDIAFEEQSTEHSPEHGSIDAQTEALFNEITHSEPIDENEVMAFLALREAAHARLFAGVPWLMSRFEALIGKYARGIDIDLDAMEEQLREASGFDPDSISNAVNLTKVGIPDTEEQRQAMASIESLLALVEGWVDCVVWRAGMAHIEHIEQLSEMARRERAIGGSAERTFESLLGLQLRPKRMREAADLWSMITADQGAQGRDAKWAHPDLLPSLADSDGAIAPTSPETPSGNDWDAELSKLLGDDGDNGSADLGDDGCQGTQPADSEDR